LNRQDSAGLALWLPRRQYVVAVEAGLFDTLISTPGEASCQSRPLAERK
jgi:hypothetical protein